MSAEINPEIKKAVGILKELIEDEANVMRAERIEKLRRDSRKSIQ